jgi:hypothetical protein
LSLDAFSHLGKRVTLFRYFHTDAEGDAAIILKAKITVILCLAA